MLFEFVMSGAGAFQVFLFFVIRLKLGLLGCL